MIRVEPCKACGAIVLLGELMGLRAKCDPAPVDAQEAVAALLAGRELHRVTYVGGRPANLSPARPAVLAALRAAEPGERPMVVGSHSCANGSAPVYRPNSTPGPPSVRQDPLAARTAPSQGLLGGTVNDAGLQDSRKPTCEACRRTIREGEEVVGIQLGDLYVYAQHVAKCYD